MTEHTFPNDLLHNAASSFIQDAVRMFLAKALAKKQVRRIKARRKFIEKYQKKLVKADEAAAAAAVAAPKDDEYPCTFTTIYDKPHGLKVDCRLFSDIDYQMNLKTFELEDLQTIIKQVKKLFQDVLDTLEKTYPEQVKDQSFVNFYLDDTATPNNGETKINIISKIQWEDWTAELIMREIKKRAQSSKLVRLNQYTSIKFVIIY